MDRFDGGKITSDAGGVVLREVEQRTRIPGRLSKCFTVSRDPDRIEHSVGPLVKQRVYGLCLGYANLNDHDELYWVRLLALLFDRADLTGEFRRLESDRRKPVAGKSALQWLERNPTKGPQGRYRKIMEEPAAMDLLLLDVFVEPHAEAPKEDWDLLVSFFPGNWRELAASTRALEGLRKDKSSESLLRTLLIHLGCRHSLREAVVRARQANLADLSDVALLKRLRKSRDWLYALCVELFREHGLVVSNSVGMQVRAFDTTTVHEPGRTGSLWHLH